MKDYIQEHFRNIGCCIFFIYTLSSYFLPFEFMLFPRSFCLFCLFVVKLNHIPLYSFITTTSMSVCGESVSVCVGMCVFVHSSPLISSVFFFFFQFEITCSLLLFRLELLVLFLSEIASVASSTI